MLAQQFIHTYDRALFLESTKYTRSQTAPAIICHSKRHFSAP
jgi:hypothetical protein